MRARLVLALLLSIAACLVGACGSSHPQREHQQAVAIACPANKSFMGCSVRATPGEFLIGQQPKAAPSGALFPDVSIWQGFVNWPAVKAWQLAHHWHPAAILKMGEYTLDSQAIRNARQIKALGLWSAGYWFVRPTGCAHEAALILWAARLLGLKVVVLDEEIAGIQGYAACLSAPLKHAGLIIVLYSAPGTWGGGSSAGLSVWVAAYGPSHVPCLFTCSVGDLTKQSILAFQFTDGTYGATVVVPGIGRDDVSVDYGITKLGVKPPPLKDPYHYKVLTAHERSVVLHYDGARMHPGRYAGYLHHTLEPELAKLAHVIYVLATHDHPHSWAKRHRGTRFQVLWQRSRGRLIRRT